MEQITDSKRMERVLIHLKMNALQLTLAAEISKDKYDSRISRILKGTYKITSNLANKICDKYPEISYDFLMTGVGTVTNIKASHPLHHEIKSVKSKIENMEHKIDFVYNLKK